MNGNEEKKETHEIHEINNDETFAGERLPIIVNRDLLPQVDFKAVNQFQASVKEIVEEILKDGYHYGYPYDVSRKKNKPKKMLLKPGVIFFINYASLLDQYEEEVTTEENGHKVFNYTCNLFRLSNKQFIAKGYGSSTTEEPRFAIRTEWKNGYSQKIAIPPETIITLQVKKQGKLRACREAVEGFFNPSIYFNNDEPEMKPAPKKEKVVLKWNPSDSEKINPEWYITTIQGLKKQGDLVDFIAIFTPEIKLFDKPDRDKINNASAKRWKELT